MKRLHFFLPVMAIAFALCCTSCSKDDDEDDEIIPVNIDGWESARYSSCKIDGLDYIEVPAEGGTFGFRCSENVAVKLTDHAFYNDLFGQYFTFKDDTRDSTHYMNEWCEAKVKGDSLIVVFKPNDSDCRCKANIGVRYGGEDCCFRFVQKRRTGIDPNLVGEWVLDPEADLGMYSMLGRYECIFYDDGTYWLYYTSDVRPTAGWGSSSECGSWGDGELKTTYGGVVDTYVLEGDKLILKPTGYGMDKPFIRLSSSKESAVPSYKLMIVPTKSSSWEYILPEEKYILKCYKSIPGKDYVMDSISVKRHTVYISNSDTYNFVDDEIDLSKYANWDYVSSMEFEMPANVASINYELKYSGNYKGRDFEGNIVTKEFWNVYYLDVYNKKVYIDNHKRY